MRPIWHRGFSLGSVVVAFAQGAAVGAMIRGIPVANGQYAGGPFGWPHPFAILTGIGLVLGKLAPYLATHIATAPADATMTPPIAGPKLRAML